MNYLYFMRRATGPGIVGNKAARLAELANAGFNVPPFFVVNSSACSETDDESRRALRRQVESALRRLCPDGAAVAVRSSSVEEDGSQCSFAGQFDSFLNVAHHAVCDHVAKVWNSAASDHIRHYRTAQGVSAEKSATPPAPAVLVQRMIQADAAGVAFAVDPVDGNPDCAVIAATRGLGDALVNGDCDGDSWRVDSRGRIVQQNLSDDGRRSLNNRRVRQVAALVREVSRHCGRPQDIEWAIHRGRIFLLQSRDITTLNNDAIQESYALWDNSNIVESYGGVTTPLTFSVARSAYAEAYRHFGRVIGISERVIRDHEKTYEQMIGLHDGRVYYNLLNWYRLLMLTPGFSYNRRFMEQMMGVTQSLPDSAVPQPRDDQRFASFRAATGLLRVSWRLAVRLVFHRSRVAQFHRKVDSALAAVELQRRSPGQLADTYDRLQAAVIPAWDTPLINDLYCMVFHGALQKLCSRWLPEALADVHNDLVSGEAGIISLEPVRRMQELAGIARQDAAFTATLLTAPVDEVRRALAGHDDFRSAFTDYLECFGDRCMDELKLESPTVADDPLPVLRTIAHLAMAAVGEAPGTAALRESAERTVFDSLKRHPLRRLIFRAALAVARARIRDRENLRFERTRVYGRVRAIFVEIGRQLKAQKVLESENDIFYLNVDEVLSLIRGTSPSMAIRGTVVARQQEFAGYIDLPDPPRRFITCGLAQLPESRQAVEKTNSCSNAQQRSGQACSPGTVRGPVRIVRDPRTADVRQGDILVAQRTDPGWVTIFPLVTGMIMERGSLLSHSAIVARELQLPCVVGVEDACSWLEDGEIVELDGATGVIRRLGRPAEDGRAA